MRPRAKRRPDPSAPYRERAREIASRVASQYSEVGELEPQRIADAVYRAFAEEANVELRQVLARMETLLSDPRNGSVDPEGLLADLHRAGAIVEELLERSRVLHHIIRLHPTEFDLGTELRRHLDLSPPSRGALRIDIEPAPVQGDRAKLLDALTHLVYRFHYLAEPLQEVVVVLHPKGRQVEGFVGIRPSHVRSSDLLREISMPLAIDDARIDTAYARAVIERHGGTIFVSKGPKDAQGIGFELPMLPAKEVANG